MDKTTFSSILAAQKNEITEHMVYSGLAKRIKSPHNQKILGKIAADELRHYHFWNKLTKQEIKPNMFMVWWYSFLATVFGLSFGLKLMERGEEVATAVYSKLTKKVSGARSIMMDEQKHEKALLNMISEERLEYASSVVLGLNDALVELTGALAGLTFAFQNGKIIAITGFIIGVAASMSMAASGYLSSKEEQDQNKGKSPIKSAVYTGVAYIVTVILLILPYLVFRNLYVALGVMLAIGILIVLAYTFYITTAKSLKFWKRFLEMTLISLTVAVISFFVGWIVRTVFGVEV